ncbi:unnamed protein product [Polarella glacialis]|uniref:protein-tyrosine-phosphatase n=1 Tax=Polarella glacialis TaxID=89957 RepID=A0A813LCB6_POLGL|nr:unnamed protein product [Polarella glacialis]
MLPHLFLGSKLAAEDRDVLRRHGITHILNTASEIPNYFEGTSEAPIYLHLSLQDSKEDNIRNEFQRCIEFIDAASDRGKVLVHCQAGISRSSTIVMAYLMARNRMTLRESFLFVKERRENIGPNEHFMRALAVYEDELRPPEERGLSAPSFSMEEYYTSTLVAMGFDEAAASKAVKLAEGRFELAVSFCLDTA